MKNKDLIAQLQQYPPDMDVAIFDWKKNSEFDEDGGTPDGIYPDIQIGQVTATEDDIDLRTEEIVTGFKPWIALGFANEDYADDRKCRVCGCTDSDCRQCIEKTGAPCYWVEDDLCSACAGLKKAPAGSTILLPGKDF